MLSSMPMLGGVRLTPLPRSVLPSVMEVRAPVADSEYGDEWSDPVTVSHVRFQRAADLALVSVGGAQPGYVFRDGSRGLVYVDAATSEGAFEVPEGSRVSVDGGDAMEVARVTRCDHMDGTCHHWELEVR